MRLKELIDAGTSLLMLSYPENEAREMTIQYVVHLLGVQRYTHIVEPDRQVSPELAQEAADAFRRMSAGEPLQYVTGEAGFYGRSFRVDPNVLIPRPETELLCRHVLSETSSSRIRILDLCTGSGCIAWTLALERPGAEVSAVDISDAALKTAASQDFGDEMKMSGAIAPEFIKADVLSPEMQAVRFAGGFDVIVSNPPYVRNSEKTLMRSNVVEHEPHLALFVPDEDPLVFYQAVARWAEMLLVPGGFGIVEINEALGQETAGIFVSSGFVSVNILKDFSSKDRFVSFRRP